MNASSSREATTGPGDTRRFLQAILGDTEGWLCIASGVPYLDKNDQVRHKGVTEQWFAWPGQVDNAEREISRLAARKDVWLCPYVMRTRERAKGNAAERTKIHADKDDGQLDLDLVRQICGSAVASGTPGNAHIYVRLTEPVTVTEHEALCRGLGDYLGGADSKISDNDLLRPVGTFNRKATARGQGNPTPVQWLLEPEYEVDPHKLAAKFGVDLANPAATNGHRHLRAEHDSAPVDLARYPSVVAALNHRTEDRSADTYRIAAACHKAGLTLAETTYVVHTRDDLKERLEGRKDDDLAAVWLKLDEQERTSHRADSPAAVPADGAELLDAVHRALTKFVIFPSEAASTAVTLWCAATHGLPAWQHATRLVIRSPQKRCGKSRLLDIVKLLSFNPMPSTDMSTAVIYRSIGDDDRKTPTLLIDEADALFGTKSKAEQNEDLRGLLNAGFQRDRTVWRCVGANQTPTEFHTFSMCALAAIKSLPDTIMDRGVVIDLKRRRSGEKVARFRIRRDTKPLLELRARLTAWVREGERLSTLGDTEPEMPDSVEDRQQDAWEPLLAIADAAGGVWPDLARAACLDLCEGGDDEGDDMQLLADVEDIFATMPNAFLRSSELVRELKERDESPWRDAELTVFKLAKMLRPFDVRPRYGPGGSVRGYWRDDFKDSFSRYSRGTRGVAE